MSSTQVYLDLFVVANLQISLQTYMTGQLFEHMSGEAYERFRTISRLKGEPFREDAYVAIPGLQKLVHEYQLWSVMFFSDCVAHKLNGILLADEPEFGKVRFPA